MKQVVHQNLTLEMMPVFIGCRCCNRWPHLLWFKATQTYFIQSRDQRSEMGSRDCVPSGGLWGEFISLPSAACDSESRSVMSGSLRPQGLYSPWNPPGQNNGVGILSLLQGIFPTQVSNPGLPHCRRILYQLSHLKQRRKEQRPWGDTELNSFERSFNSNQWK